MPKVHPIVFYTRTTAFGIIFFLGILAINLVQLPGRLLFPLRKVYRNYMRFTQRLFGSLILTLTFIFSPLSINLTGAHQGLKSNTFAPIIANHQIYTDWWYIWLLACFRDAHGEMKILLIERLSKLPLIGTVSKLILGWGMSCYEFVFLARKWQVDRPRIVKNLDLAQTDGNPLWLLVFPEGTGNFVNLIKLFVTKPLRSQKHLLRKMVSTTSINMF